MLRNLKERLDMWFVGMKGKTCFAEVTRNFTCGNVQTQSNMKRLVLMQEFK